MTLAFLPPNLYLIILVSYKVNFWVPCASGNVYFDFLTDIANDKLTITESGLVSTGPSFLRFEIGIAAM